MIETSLISLKEALAEGQTLKKGMQVVLPTYMEATIYGFIAIEEDEEDLFDLSIDMPPLGEAKVLSNRVITSINDKMYRFPIFSEARKATEIKYPLRFLYVPRLLNLPSQWEVKYYMSSLSDETPNPKVSRIDGVEIEDNIAYYYSKEDDLYFQSSSRLSGIGNGMVVITRRLSKCSDDIKYEIFNSNEVLIEKNGH